MSLSTHLKEEMARFLVYSNVQIFTYIKINKPRKLNYTGFAGKKHHSSNYVIVIWKVTKHGFMGSM